MVKLKNTQGSYLVKYGLESAGKIQTVSILTVPSNELTVTAIRTASEMVSSL